VPHVLLRRHWRPLVAAAGSLALLIPIGLDAADASSPTSGSISDTSTSTSWSGGPFAVPNVTGTLGDPICNVATPCDDYALHVSTPAGYGDAHQLKISVQWPLATADFDVYVLNAAGSIVGTSASSADPETVLLPPDTGDYTVRVVPFLPLAQSYTASASLVSKPTNPPPGTFTPPTYSNYPAPESFGGAHDAGEPSIGVNYNTGAVMYQAGLSTAKVTFDSASPANATWADKTASIANGCPLGDTTSLDPILFTDHVTGRTFESQLAGKTALTCYTDNDGDSWNPTSGSGINSGVDHQTIGGGIYSPNDPIGPLTSYPNQVYYCSQDIADANCAASHDGGLTWGPAVPMYDLTQCGGLHGHVKVSPVDGTVYVPNKGCGSGQAVAVSEDGGTTWSVRGVPGSTPGDSDPSVGIGSNGTVYFGYQAADGHARIAVSNDKGQTWKHDQDVGAALGIQNVVFPAVVAGDDDRAAFAFIGTTTGGNYQDTANFHGVWHVYVATTIDGGQSWETVDATPNDPVQRGSICTGGTTCGNDRNLLDFIDATVDQQGRVLVGWADGCTGACAQAGGTQNYDALATITRQDSGPRLFSAYDAMADLTVSNVTATKTSTGTQLSATLTNAGQALAKSATVSFANGSTAVGTTAPVDIAAGASKVVSLTTTKLKKGTYTITVVADPANAVKESNEGNNKVQTTLAI
jgi:hypothetical protein